MDISQLRDIRMHLTNEIGKIQKDRENLLPAKEENMPLLRSSQIEELLFVSRAILAELTYMNDKEGEVNNG